MIKSIKSNLNVILPASLAAVFVFIALSLSIKKEEVKEPVVVKEALTEASVLNNNASLYEVLVDKQGGSGLEVIQRGLALKDIEVLTEGVNRVNDKALSSSQRGFKDQVEALGEASRVIVLLQSAGQGKLSFKVVAGLLKSFNKVPSNTEEDLLALKAEVHSLADNPVFKQGLEKWSQGTLKEPISGDKVLESVEVATNLFFIDNLFDSGKYLEFSVGILSGVVKLQEPSGNFKGVNNKDHWLILKNLTSLSFYNPSLVKKKVLTKAWEHGLKNKPANTESFKEVVILWGALSSNPDLVNQVLSGKF